MSTGPLVTVGIPTHRRPHYLREAIDSVVAQTFTNWQLIVSEDGPASEEVQAAIRPYLDDRRVRYVATGTNVGAAANMSRLIQAADTPYVTLLHDDDRWRPPFLERSVELLEQAPQCGFVCSEEIRINEQGVEIRRSESPFREGVLESTEVIPFLYRANYVETVTVVARRSAYEDVGPWFDERFRRIYDYEMWFRLAVRFPIGHLLMWEAEWRNHGKQSSFEGRIRGDEELRFLDHIEELMRRDLPELQISPRISRRTRSRAYITRAIDGLELHQPSGTLRDLRRGIALYPPSLFDPQVAVGTVGLMTGRPGRKAVGELRVRMRRRRMRHHFST